MPGSRKAWGDGKMRIMQNAEFKMQNGQDGSAGGFISNSSFIIHHSSFSVHPSRRGITLMEVLISIFVLSIGLLGVAAIIPLGQLALWETAKADRCGACGRAAMARSGQPAAGLPLLVLDAWPDNNNRELLGFYSAVSL